MLRSARRCRERSASLSRRRSVPPSTTPNVFLSPILFAKRCNSDLLLLLLSSSFLSLLLLFFQVPMTECTLEDRRVCENVSR